AVTIVLESYIKVCSKTICYLFNIDINLCPQLVESYDEVGKVSSEYADEIGLAESTRVFTGGADNACGAIGSGILEDGKPLCSIGTSGVILSYEVSQFHNCSF